MQEQAYERAKTAEKLRVSHQRKPKNPRRVMRQVWSQCEICGLNEPYAYVAPGYKLKEPLTHMCKRCERRTQNALVDALTEGDEDA